MCGMNKVTKYENYKLPEELMIEIAPHLPAKSIGRFRCVSKEWNIFLSSQEFVKSHLQHHETDYNDRIIFKGRYNKTPHIITPAKCRRLEEKYKNFKFIGSCNGLVLLELSSLVVMNPITLRATAIPVIKPDGASTSFGLGYNNIDDDYKIIAMYKNCLNNVAISTMAFSLKTRSCKKLADFPFLSDGYVPPGVYVNGCLYWFVTYEIFAFDLSTEKFERVASPIGFDHRYSYPLCVLGGCLALLDRRHYHDYSLDRFVMMPVDVWIMENLRYWRKFTIDNYPPDEDPGGDRYDVVGRLGEFEFVLAKNKVKFAAYNCKTGIWRDVDIDGLPDLVGGMFTFRESLVCPHEPNTPSGPLILD